MPAHPNAALGANTAPYHSLNLASRKWETGVLRRKNRLEGKEAGQKF